MSQKKKYDDNYMKLRRRIIGNMYGSGGPKNYRCVIYVDYKGQPCRKEDSYSQIYFNARPSFKGFIFFTRSNEHDTILHDELVSPGVPTVQAKVIGPTRHTKIFRRERDN